MENDRAPTAPEYAAILARDAKQDGRFLYAVRSTGVYCHPSCASRPPKRENVRIFKTGEAARAAGYRPCKRCKPETDQATPDRRLERARRLIEETLGNGEAPPSLKALSAVAHMGATHLQRRFAAAYGLSPKAYAEAHRLTLLKRELKTGRGVTDAIYGAGFGGPSRVYEKAGRLLGMTPADYRRGGEGLTLRVAIRNAPPSHLGLGRVLVAESPRGIAALLLGSSDAAMLRELRDEFPEAAISRDDKGGREAIAALEAVLAGDPVPKNLPLDLRGTAFQVRVWTALQAIPAGETRTYAAIAKQLGTPGAARAVGSACANNILGVLVPCHRAIRADGGLGGYRWGLGRKQALLDIEQAASSEAAE